MYKVLFVASVESHLKAFHVPYLKYFKEKGFEVSTAAKGENGIPYVDKHYNIEFDRSPYSAKNIACYRLLKDLIRKNQYDIIHCHTPAASVLTRLAARKARKNGNRCHLYGPWLSFFQRRAPIVCVVPAC